MNFNTEIAIEFTKKNCENSREVAPTSINSEDVHSTQINYEIIVSTQIPMTMGYFAEGTLE